MEDIFENKLGSEAETNVSFESTSRDSWKVMFERLYGDMSGLFEREGMLIRNEVNEKISEAKVGLASLAIGGGLLLVGLFAFVATAIIVLAQFIELWIAAVLVTSIILLVGGIVVISAKKKLASNRLKPRQSIETLKEIKSTFKERIDEFKYQH